MNRERADGPVGDFAQRVLGGDSFRLAVRALRQQVAVPRIAPSRAASGARRLPRLVRERDNDPGVYRLALCGGGRNRCCGKDACTENRQAQEAGVHDGAHVGYGSRWVGRLSAGIGSTQRTRGSACRRVASTRISWLIRSGVTFPEATFPGATPKIPVLSGPSTTRAPLARSTSSASPTVTERSKEMCRTFGAACTLSVCVLYNGCDDR